MDGGVGTGRHRRREDGVEKLGGGKGWKARGRRDVGGGREKRTEGEIKELERSFGGENSVK